MSPHAFVFWIAPLLTLTAGASAAPCLPIPATTPTSCSNDFDLVFPAGTGNEETSLISSVEASTFSTSIKHRFVAKVIDALVQVSWKDKNGAVLFSGDNQSFFAFFPTEVDTFDWGEKRRGSVGIPGTKIESGTADFTGSVGINFPCVEGPCAAGYHEFLPTPFRTPPSPLRLGDTEGQGTQHAMAQAVGAAMDPEISITEIQGALTVYDLDPSAPEDLDQAIATTVLDYSSTVEWSGSDYLYRYSITNHSDAKFNASWAVAELSGVLDAQASVSRSFSSPLQPRIVHSIAETTFGSFVISDGVGLLQPVPIPASLPLLAAAIGCLAVRRRKGNAYRKDNRAVRRNRGSCVV